MEIEGFFETDNSTLEESIHPKGPYKDKIAHKKQRLGSKASHICWPNM